MKSQSFRLQNRTKCVGLLIKTIKNRCQLGGLSYSDNEVQADFGDVQAKQLAS